jgi:Putative methyltransferase
MGQKKLIRFAEIAEFRNVLQYPQAMKGKWLDHFHNNHPLTLELACGKGEYTVGLAAMHPERNFIGVDLKGNRIWVGAKKALTSNLDNVAFLRTHIDKITDYFEPAEVEEIWITFPDPQLRVSHAKKKTHPPQIPQAPSRYWRCSTVNCTWPGMMCIQGKTVCPSLISKPITKALILQEATGSTISVFRCPWTCCPKRIWN